MKLDKDYSNELTEKILDLIQKIKKQEFNIIVGVETAYHLSKMSCFMSSIINTVKIDDTHPLIGSIYIIGCKLNVYLSFEMQHIGDIKVCNI